MLKMKNVSDEALIPLIASGKSAAFSELFNRYWDRLYRRALGILRDEAAAADLTQNVFMDLWERRGTVFIENVSAYLFQALRYQAAKHIDRMKFPQETLEVLKEYAVPDSIEEELYGKELELRLGTSIEALPERCKEIFKMSRQQHLSTRQIAEKLNLSEHTVETQIKRALKKLKATVSLLWVLLHVI